MDDETTALQLEKEIDDETAAQQMFLSWDQNVDGLGEDRWNSNSFCYPLQAGGQRFRTPSLESRDRNGAGDSGLVNRSAN
ncbi:unnamed protein product [Linum trigynum]|uniref:Uncharacterized protein n=1 Tax=Linum trigynum TaxID=586398 RepID=A0AAV2FYC9_9ROSI